MKRLGITACILLIAVAHTNLVSCESYSRIGLSFGGVHIVGLYFERHFEDTAVRAQVGYMIHALSLNLTALHYFDTSRHRPYIGIGYMKHISEMSLQGPNLFCVPVGIDVDLSRDQYISVELIPAMSFSPDSRDKNPNGRLTEYILPLPCVSYKHKL